MMRGMDKDRGKALGEFPQGVAVRRLLDNLLIEQRNTNRLLWELLGPEQQRRVAPLLETPPD